MIVKPDEISARSAPSTSPLNICDTKLAQLITDQPRARSLSRERGSGVVPELAAEGVRLLHQSIAGHDLDHVVIVFLALHVLFHLALDDDHGADALVVLGAVVHIADEGRDRFALLIGLDDIRRIEAAGLLD